MEGGSASCTQRAGGPQPCTHEEPGALPTGAASSTAPRPWPKVGSDAAQALIPRRQTREGSCVLLTAGPPTSPVEQAPESSHLHNTCLLLTHWDSATVPGLRMHHHTQESNSPVFLKLVFFR